MRLPGQIMLDLVKPALGETGIEFVELRGDTTDRTRPVARFQRGEVPLFLISLKAGGTGLNLTAADAVIHYDPWWNPAVEDQATERAHRIGQDKPVLVYKLVAQVTALWVSGQTIIGGALGGLGLL
jgi:SNF2 family DNA or RNA helicase